MGDEIDKKWRGPTGIKRIVGPGLVEHLSSRMAREEAELIDGVVADERRGRIAAVGALFLALVAIGLYLWALLWAMTALSDAVFNYVLLGR